MGGGLDIAQHCVPTFVRDRPLTRAALAFAARAHGGDRREADVAGCQHDAALIYAADKLSKARELRIRLHAEPAFAAASEGRGKLDHYWRSLTMLEGTLDGHPLVSQLRFELEAIRDLPPCRMSARRPLTA